MRPPRPNRRDAKGDWQRWAYDSLVSLRPSAGAGVITNLLSESHRRLLRQHARGSHEEADDDDPDFFRFGFSTNRWGPYPLGTSIVLTTITRPGDFVYEPNLQRYWTYNGSPVYYPGELTPPGVPLPGTFRFTSPFRTRSCRIVGLTTGAEWHNPVPDVLAPGQSVDFNAPAYVGVTNTSWAARKI
jgi:hypothetical protein